MKLHRQPTYEEMKAALDATALPPHEGYERMVRWGIINRKGRLTRLYGGEAELESEAVEYLTSQEQDNGHRS